MGSIALDSLAWHIREELVAAGLEPTVSTDEVRTALPKILAALGFGPDGQPLALKHTCNPDRPGKPLPFGRRDPLGECARCAQLNAGAEPLAAPSWVDNRAIEQRNLAMEDRRRREHFAPNGPHARGVCGPVCTAFDY